MTDAVSARSACAADAVVTLEGAVKSFGANQVLKGISLEVC